MRRFFASTVGDQEAGGGGGHNYVRWSEALDNAVWYDKNLITVVPNDALAPDGTMTADRVVSGNAFGEHRIAQSVGISDRATSMYAKPDGLNYLVFRQNGGSGFTSCIFNLATQSINLGAGWSDATIETLPNGWFRCSAKVTTSNSDHVFMISNRELNTHSGNGVAGMWIWGNQVNLSELTGYVKTEDTIIEP